MISIINCYRKVNNECFKFIKSQETPKEKFKNKEKMIKSFLIPISFWIAKKAKKNKLCIVGLSGGQGSGKTTSVKLPTVYIAFDDQPDNDPESSICSPVYSLTK